MTAAFIDKWFVFSACARKCQPFFRKNGLGGPNGCVEVYTDSTAVDSASDGVILPLVAVSGLVEGWVGGENGTGIHVRCVEGSCVGGVR